MIETDELMYVRVNLFIYNLFCFHLLSTRWQKIEDMHDLKDNRFKMIKERLAKSAKPSINNNDDENDDDDNDDDENLEKELQSMYNWRQKRS